MTKKQLRNQNQGFTIIELIVGITVLAIMIAALTNFFVAIEAIQRQTQHLSVATRIAEQKIESLRNNHYNSIGLSPPPIDFTSELPDSLATPRSAQVEVSEPQPGIKRLDVTITYREGARSKTIRMSSLLGNIGISQ